MICKPPFFKTSATSSKTSWRLRSYLDANPPAPGTATHADAAVSLEMTCELVAPGRTIFVLPLVTTGGGDPYQTDQTSASPTTLHLDTR